VADKFLLPISPTSRSRAGVVEVEAAVGVVVFVEAGV